MITVPTKPGVYRHYKGGLYRVLFVARMSTNGPTEDRPHVVYVSLAHGVINIRDEEEFHEIVANFKPVPRFTANSFKPVPRFTFIDERLTYED
jgi:hypothetical protein